MHTPAASETRSRGYYIPGKCTFTLGDTRSNNNDTIRFITDNSAPHRANMYAQTQQPTDYMHSQQHLASPFNNNLVDSPVDNYTQQQSHSNAHSNIITPAGSHHFQQQQQQVAFEQSTTSFYGDNIQHVAGAACQQFPPYVPQQKTLVPQQSTTMHQQCDFNNSCSSSNTKQSAFMNNTSTEPHLSAFFDTTSAQQISPVSGLDGFSSSSIQQQMSTMPQQHNSFLSTASFLSQQQHFIQQQQHQPAFMASSYPSKACSRQSCHSTTSTPSQQSTLVDQQSTYSNNNNMTYYMYSNAPSSSTQKQPEQQPSVVRCVDVYPAGGPESQPIIVGKQDSLGLSSMKRILVSTIAGRQANRPVLPQPPDQKSIRPSPQSRPNRPRSVPKSQRPTQSQFVSALSPVSLPEHRDSTPWPSNQQPVLDELAAMVAKILEGKSRQEAFERSVTKKGAKTARFTNDQRDCMQFLADRFDYSCPSWSVAGLAKLIDLDVKQVSRWIQNRRRANNKQAQANRPAVPPTPSPSMLDEPTSSDTQAPPSRPTTAPPMPVASPPFGGTLTPAPTPAPSTESPISNGSLPQVSSLFTPHNCSSLEDCEAMQPLAKRSRSEAELESQSPSDITTGALELSMACGYGDNWALDDTMSQLLNEVNSSGSPSVDFYPYAPALQNQHEFALHDEDYATIPAQYY